MGILRTDFSSFLLKINCLRRNINWILVDICSAIFMDIALLVHWQSVRYKIETPYLATLRLCVKYAS